MMNNDEACAHHKQAAADHQETANYHLKAAECHEKNDVIDAKDRSQSAMECCNKAQTQTEAACACSSQ